MIRKERFLAALRPRTARPRADVRLPFSAADVRALDRASARRLQRAGCHPLRWHWITTAYGCPSAGSAGSSPSSSPRTSTWTNGAQRIRRMSRLADRRADRLPDQVAAGPGQVPAARSDVAGPGQRDPDRRADGERRHCHPGRRARTLYPGDVRGVRSLRPLSIEGRGPHESSKRKRSRYDHLHFHPRRCRAGFPAGDLPRPFYWPLAGPAVDHRPRWVPRLRMASQAGYGCRGRRCRQRKTSGL